MLNIINRFNPRARDGRENKEAQRITDMQSFNPRARDGREVRTLECRTLLLGFNPRARDGREAAALGLTVAVDVSIHAPVMDANRYHF